MPTIVKPGSSDRPQARPQLPADAQAVSERLRLFLLVILGLLLVAQLALPFRLAGIVLGALAGWVGIGLLVRLGRLRKAGFQSRGSIMVSVGLGLTAVLLFTLVAEAAYYPLAAQLERCRSGANTQTAEQACQQAAKNRVNNMVDRISRQD